MQLARAIKHAYQRAAALIALLDRCSPSELFSLLGEVKAAVAAAALSEDQRVTLLASGARHLPVAERVKLAVDATQVFNWEAPRIEALIALAPHLPPMQQAEAVARAISDADAVSLESAQYKAEDIACVGPFLSGTTGDRLLRDGLAAARQAEPEPRARVIGLLAPWLPNHLLDEAVSAATQFEDEYRSTLRIRALLALGEHHPDGLPQGELAQFRDAARRLRSDENREYVLEAIRRLEQSGQVINEPQQEQRSATVPTNAPAGLLRQATIAARRQLLRVLPRPAVRQVVHAWVESENPTFLAALGGRLDGRVAAEAFECALSVEDEFKRCRLLTQLLGLGPASLRGEIAEQVLAIGGDVSWRFVDRVAPWINPSRLRHHLTTAEQLADLNARVWQLSGLLPRLESTLAAECLERLLAAATSEEQNRDNLTAVVREHGARLSRRQLLELINVATARRYPHHRVDLLLALTPQFQGKERQRLLAAAFRDALLISWSSRRRNKIAGILGELTGSPDQLLELYRAPLALDRSREERLDDLMALAPLVRMLGGPPAVSETMKAVRDVARWWL